MSFICNPDLLPIDIACEDAAVGGLKRVFVAPFDAITIMYNVDEIDEIWTDEYYEIEFNQKDSATNFAEVFNNSSDLTFGNEVTIQIETKLQTNQQVIEKYTNNYQKVVVICEDGSGNVYLAGASFGLKCQAQYETGASRGDKAKCLITFFGEDASLSIVEDKSKFIDIIW